MKIYRQSYAAYMSRIMMPIIYESRSKSTKSKLI